MNHRLPLYLMGIRSHLEVTLMKLDFRAGLRALACRLNGCYVYYIPDDRSLLTLNAGMAAKWWVHLSVPTG